MVGVAVVDVEPVGGGVGGDEVARLARVVDGDAAGLFGDVAEARGVDQLRHDLRFGIGVEAPEAHALFGDVEVARCVIGGAIAGFGCDAELAHQSARRKPPSRAEIMYCAIWPAAAERERVERVDRARRDRGTSFRRRSRSEFGRTVRSRAVPASASSSNKRKRLVAPSSAASVHALVAGCAVARIDADRRARGHAADARAIKAVEFDARAFADADDQAAAVGARNDEGRVGVGLFGRRSFRGWRRR